jgi:NAD(P)-dependent dehydrogenase (short-subunit alcohol dehydrogenase family)
MPGRLDSKVALITGAGCIGPGWGNGRAAAVLFAREGAKVFAVDKDADSMTETVARVGNDGEIATHICDVLEDAQVRGMTEACRKAFGRIDILVNNVGGSAAGGVAEMSEEAFDRQIDYNLKSVFLACRHVIPVMIAQGGGAIVNTASASGTRYTGAPQIGYASAKAAVIQFSRVTAVQYAANGIRVNTVIPGQMHTPNGGSASGQAAHWRRRRGFAQIARRPHPARFHGGRARYGGRRIIFGFR